MLKTLNYIFIGIPYFFEDLDLAKISLFMQLFSQFHEGSLQHILIVFVDHSNPCFLGFPIRTQPIDNTTSIPIFTHKLS